MNSVALVTGPLVESLGPVQSHLPGLKPKSESTQLDSHGLNKLTQQSVHTAYTAYHNLFRLGMHLAALVSNPSSSQRSPSLEPGKAGKGTGGEPVGNLLIKDDQRLLSWIMHCHPALKSPHLDRSRNGFSNCCHLQDFPSRGVEPQVNHRTTGCQGSEAPKRYKAITYSLKPFVKTAARCERLYYTWHEITRSNSEKERGRERFQHKSIEVSTGYMGIHDKVLGVQC